MYGNGDQLAVLTYIHIACLFQRTTANRQRRVNSTRRARDVCCYIASCQGWAQRRSNVGGHADAGVARRQGTATPPSPSSLISAGGVSCTWNADGPFVSAQIRPSPGGSSVGSGDLLDTAEMRHASCCRSAAARQLHTRSQLPSVADGAGLG